MSAKFKRSWELFKASINATFRYPKLLWFPLIIGILTAVIALFFISVIALPVVLHPTGYHLNQKEHWAALKDYYLPTPARPVNGDQAPSDSGSLLVTKSSIGAAAMPEAHRISPLLSYPVLLLLYFGSMFLATFFNVAFYSEIMAAFDGRGVSFRRGLQTSRSRVRSILAWSLLAGAVGWVIRMIEERLPFVGRIVMGLIGLAWSVAAVFAIPVIIQSDARNPIEVLKQSAMTLKRAWGEGLIGYLGFSAGSLVMFFGSLIPLFAGIAIAMLFHSVVVGIITAVLWLMGLFVMAYISGVAGHVYRCALYKYATEGTVPEPYNQGMMDLAWKVKKS